MTFKLFNKLNEVFKTGKQVILRKYLNTYKEYYNIKLDLVHEDIDDSDLPPWSWILTMDFERERKGVLTDWDFEREGYED